MSAGGSDAGPVWEKQRIARAGHSLVLHRLTAGAGRPLLLLHPLRESSAWWFSAVPRWPGPVYALDWSGHGESPPIRGRWYSPAVLAADADAALAHLGQAVVVGAGLGAYVALLVAAARPEDVPAAVLLDGPGLVGGGPTPVHPQVPGPPLEPIPPGSPSDPAVAELDRDVRPPAYARALAGNASRLVFVGTPALPTPWWDELCPPRGEGPHLENAERAEGPLQAVLDALAVRFAQPTVTVGERV